MNPARITRPGRVLSVLMLAVPLLAAAAPAHAYRYWNAAVSALASDPVRWTPNGVPFAGEDIEVGQIGSYRITFNGSVTQTNYLTAGQGNPFVDFTSPHTSSALIVGSSTSTVLTCEQGTLNMQWMELGGSGGNSTLTLTSTNPGGAYADFHSQAVTHAVRNGDNIGYFGNGTLNVFGGAQYYSGNTVTGNWGLNVGLDAGYSGSVFVAGRNAFNLFNSGLRTVGSNDMTVGVNGTGLLQITNRGFVDASNNVFLGYYPGSSGTVNVGPSTQGSVRLTVRNNLGIGATIFDTPSGAALMNVTGSAFVDVVGSVEIGNPGGDQGSTLRMGAGTVKINNGLRVYNTPGGALDMRGGILHLIGGAFQWPASRTLVVSSQVGAPEMWIRSGVISTGPNWPGITPQLQIGRGGSGLLRVSQLGTVLSCGLGPTILGDSTSGNGRVVVDTLGTFATTGYTTIGNFGLGTFDVLNGGQANLGAVYVGRQNGLGVGGGTLTVKGAGSALIAHNLFEVGSPSGDPNTGQVLVDSGATVLLDTTTPGFDPLLTIRSNTGRVTVANGASFTATGPTNLFGQVVLNGGTFGTTHNSMGSASSIRGWGQVNGPVFGYGRIEPYAVADSFGVIRMGSTFDPQAGAHYVVNLGAGTEPRCDTVIVAGAATLGGTLDLRTEPGFDGLIRKVYTIMTCGSRVGTFSAVTWNGSPIFGQAEVVYFGDKVQVFIFGTVGVEPSITNAPAELRFAAAGSPSAPAVLLDLPMAADVDVRLYDITGRVAASLHSGPMGAGRHRFELRNSGAQLASGAYFARATVRGAGQTIQRTVKTTMLH